MLDIIFNSDKLRILYWNADGIRTKQHELNDLAVGELNVDIIALCETRLADRSRINIPGFTCYRADKRGNGSGQGVAILVRVDIAHFITPALATQNLEAIGVSLNLPNGEVMVCSVYQSPNLPLLTSDLDLLVATGNRLLIVGDFNAKHPYWSPGPTNPHGKKLLEYVVNNDIIIHAPSEPTLVHYRTGLSPSTPDLLLAKNVHSINDISTAHALSSNHLPVLVEINIKMVREPIKKHNFAKADWNRYRDVLNDKIFLTNNVFKEECEIDSAITDFQDQIIFARDSSIPVTTLKPWNTTIPRCIKRKIKTKNQLRRYANKETDVLTRQIFVHEAKSLQSKINVALKSHHDNLWNLKLQKVDNPRNDIWRLAKSFKTTTFSIPALKSKNGSLTTNQNDQCELLADTFLNNTLLTHDWSSEKQCLVGRSLSSLDYSLNEQSLHKLVHPVEVKKCIQNLKTRKAPGSDNISNILLRNLPQKGVVLLTKLFNACLLLSYFPLPWKTAKVIAIRKPGKDPTDPVGYRPISLLPCIGKLFEKIIYVRLSRATSDLLIDEQFGFRQAHSTVQQLARVAESVSHGLNKKESTGMFLLDIEKAFDTVWHQGLLHKLISLNIAFPLIKLIRSYLYNRSFQVHINNYSSSSKPVLAGVPQGSILGPHLFLIFINDIPIQPRTSLACFADDTASFTSSKDIDLVIDRLQLSVELLSSYFLDWKLEINASKTTAIMFTRNRTSPVRNLIIKGFKIPWSNSVKYLGVSLDRRLNWTENCIKVRTKGLKALNTLSPILNRNSCLSSTTKLRIYRTLVRPCLTYACPVWSSTCKTNIKNLQVIQNKAVKYSFNTPFRTNLHELHLKIGLPTLESYIFKLSKRLFLNSNPFSKNKLIRNICKTRKKDLPYYDKYCRYKLPHHWFLECNE